MWLYQHVVEAPHLTSSMHAVCYLSTDWQTRTALKKSSPKPRPTTRACTSTVTSSPVSRLTQHRQGGRQATCQLRPGWEVGVWGRTEEGGRPSPLDGHTEGQSASRVAGGLWWMVGWWWWWGGGQGAWVVVPLCDPEPLHEDECLLQHAGGRAGGPRQLWRERERDSSSP